MSGSNGELARVIPLPGVRNSAMASEAVAADLTAGAGAGRAPGRTVARPALSTAASPGRIVGDREISVAAAAGVGARVAPRPTPRVTRPARVVRPGRVRGCSSRTVRAQRVRLTRRGRIVVVVAALLAIAVAGLSGAALGSIGGQPVPEGTSTVRVEPGETLWGIAQRVDADADVREVVQRIGELNDLTHGEQIAPGQRLTVPSGR